MRNILLYFSLKYNGDWYKIYNAINNKEKMDQDKLEILKQNLKSNFITILDDNYPESLKKTRNPPFVLYYRGNLELLYQKRIATVVGTRHPTKYGLSCTTNIVKELSDYQYVICSGLALGIDAAAHKSALDNSLPTIGVVANGLDIYYPKSNSSLYEDIIENDGLILSEYPDGVEPSKDKFNMRNRLLAAFGNFVIVTEAYSKSGTCLTVSHALFLSKDIYVFPTQADGEHYNNTLIKDGAILIESVEDIMIV